MVARWRKEASKLPPDTILDRKRRDERAAAETQYYSLCSIRGEKPTPEGLEAHIHQHLQKRGLAFSIPQLIFWVAIAALIVWLISSVG